MHDYLIAANRKQVWKAGDRDSEITIYCRSCCLNTSEVPQYRVLAVAELYTPAEIATIMRQHEHDSA